MNTLQNKPDKNKRPSADLLLLAGLAAAGLLVGLLLLTQLKKGDYAVVTVDGKQVAAYPLAQNRSELITTPWGTNLLVIENGTAAVTQADCPDSSCIHMGKINQDWQSIVCLPHRLMVTVQQGRPSASSQPDVILH